MDKNDLKVDKPVGHRQFHGTGMVIYTKKNIRSCSATSQYSAQFQI